MSNGDILVGEIIGTSILVLFGAGVRAALTLRHSKARAAGWIARFQATVRTTGTMERTTDEPTPALGVFSAIPEIRKPAADLITEIIAMAAVVLPVLAFGPTEGLGASGTTVLIVSLLVLGIGLSPGGPTGHAIKSARDLGPRLVRAFLPTPDMGTPKWSCARVSVVGPLVGGTLAGPINHAAF
ncbi:aquaporin [Streptomyces chromofuscus]|uniref:Aquaporin n=1 Tax=Streptomyces chromofuscus TaxID=42881 RepID=A0A7M2TAD1_STRCW|nr:aquaporin [Streptomyces chromofuscus]QOV45502.1 aquaporin [Streptomyces chromofuscus]GGT20293.1 hypothetical protein GCM10010254_46190 [Streptomyces chromofuscus]